MHSTNMDSTNRPFFNFSILDSFPVKVGLEVAGDFSKAAVYGGLNYCYARVAMRFGYINPFSCNPLVFVVTSIGLTIIFKSMDGIYALGCLAAGPRERAESSDSSPSNGRTNCFRQYIWTVIHKCEKIEERIDSISSRLFHIRSFKELRMKEKFENINSTLLELEALSEAALPLNTLEKTRKAFFDSLELSGKTIASCVISWQILTSLGVQLASAPWLALGCSAFFIANLGYQIHAEEFVEDRSRQSKLESTKWIVEQFNPNQDCVDLKKTLSDMKKMDLRESGIIHIINFERLMSLCPNLEELTLSERQHSALIILNVHLKLKKDLDIKVV